MKNIRILQFISVSMAVLMLISTLSIRIEKHYCGEHLVDVAFFTEAENCGMEASDKSLETSDENSLLIKKSCCKDLVDVHQGQDELSLEKTKEFNSYQKVLILSFTYAFSGLDSLESENNTPFNDHSPPRFVRDLQILNEVFLIWFRLIMSTMP